MQLLDRYLNAVRKSLPRGQEDDILAEISDAIQSEAEEKEAQLGRPLTLDEESVILKAYGNPRMVASKYASQQYLIGPAFLPFYWYTLRVVLVIALIVAFFASATFFAGSALPSLVVVWGSLSIAFFVVIGLITFIFFLLEYFQNRFGRDPGLDRWDPRTLPISDARYVTRSQSIGELIVNVVVMLWLLSVPWTRHALSHLFIGPLPNAHGNQPFQFSAVWQQVILPVFVLYAINSILNIVNVVRPNWFALRAYIHAGINLGFAGMAAALLVLPHLVIASPAAHITPHLVDKVAALNALTHWTRRSHRNRLLDRRVLRPASVAQSEAYTATLYR